MIPLPVPSGCGFLYRSWKHHRDTGPMILGTHHISLQTDLATLKKGFQESTAMPFALDILEWLS
jgi:hypothetical protein